MPVPCGTATGAVGAVPAVSNGVLSKLTHIPRKSGWPSGVRGTVQVFPDWAETGAGGRAAIAIASTAGMHSSRPRPHIEHLPE
jgi:hypothetical protein